MLFSPNPMSDVTGILPRNAFLCVPVEITDNQTPIMIVQVR